MLRNNNNKPFFTYTTEDASLLEKFKPLFPESRFTNSLIVFPADQWDADIGEHRNWQLTKQKMEMLLAIYAGEFPQIMRRDDDKLESICRRVVDACNNLGDLLLPEIEKLSPLTYRMGEINNQIKSITACQMQIPKFQDKISSLSHVGLIYQSSEQDKQRDEYRNALFAIESMNQAINIQSKNLLENIRLALQHRDDPRLTPEYIANVYNEIPRTCTTYNDAQRELYHFLDSCLPHTVDENEKIKIREYKLQCAMNIGDSELFSHTLHELCGFKGVNLMKGDSVLSVITKMAELNRTINLEEKLKKEPETTPTKQGFFKNY